MKKVCCMVGFSVDSQGKTVKDKAVCKLCGKKGGGTTNSKV